MMKKSTWTSAEHGEFADCQISASQAIFGK